MFGGSIVWYVCRRPFGVRFFAQRQSLCLPVLPKLREANLGPNMISAQVLFSDPPGRGFGVGSGFCAASNSACQGDGKGCIPRTRARARPEPFPTISSTIPFSVSEGSGGDADQTQTERVNIHVMSEGMRIGQLEVSSHVGTSAIQSAAEKLWNARLDFPSQPVSVAEIADEAGRIYAHLLKPEPWLIPGQPLRGMRVSRTSGRVSWSLLTVCHLCSLDCQFPCRLLILQSMCGINAVIRPLQMQLDMRGFFWQAPPGKPSSVFLQAPLLEWFSQLGRFNT